MNKKKKIIKKIIESVKRQISETQFPVFSGVQSMGVGENVLGSVGGIIDPITGKIGSNNPYDNMNKGSRPGSSSIGPGSRPGSSSIGSRPGSSPIPVRPGVLGKP